MVLRQALLFKHVHDDNVEQFAEVFVSALINAVPREKLTGLIPADVDAGKGIQLLMILKSPDIANLS